MSTQANLREKSVTPDQLLVQQSGNNNNTSLAYLQNRLSGGGGAAITVPVPPCYAATSANVSLTGMLASGDAYGATAPNGSRLLVAAQTDHTENGLYDYNSAGAWTRTVDPITAGMKIPVLVGPTGDIGGSTWTCTNASDPVVGTDAITFALDRGTVPDGSMVTAKYADGSVTPAKLSFDPATQAELDAHAATVASTSVLGHVKIDGTTVTLNGSNQLVAATSGVIVVRAVNFGSHSPSQVPNGIPSTSDSDGVTVVAGDKVLKLVESDQTRNGLWIVSAGNWTRSTDVIVPGLEVQVMSGGATVGGAIYYCKNTTTPVIGTSNITFGLARALPVDNSVSAASIIDGSVGKDELDPAVAGAGLVGGGGSALAVNPDNSTIEVASDQVRVKAGGITDTQVASGISYSKLSGAPTSLPPSGTAGGDLSGTYPNPTIAASIVGDGLTGGDGSPLAVNVDGSTVEVASDVVRVKASGITPNELSGSVAGPGLSGGDTSALAVNVDGVTMDIVADTVVVKDGGISSTQLDAILATPGSFTNMNATVGPDGRISSASDGSGGMIFMVLLGNTGITIPGGATRYIGVTQTTAQVNESDATIDLARAGVFSSMLLRVTGSQPGDGSLVVTTRCAGADTTVVCTIAANGTTGTVQDVTHTTGGAATNKFCFKIVNNSASASIALNEIHVCY